MIFFVWQDATFDDGHRIESPRVACIARENVVTAKFDRDIEPVLDIDAPGRVRVFLGAWHGVASARAYCKVVARMIADLTCYDVSDGDVTWRREITAPGCVRWTRTENARPTREMLGLDGEEEEPVSSVEIP